MFFFCWIDGGALVWGWDCVVEAIVVVRSRKSRKCDFKILVERRSLHSTSTPGATFSPLRIRLILHRPASHLYIANGNPSYLIFQESFPCSYLLKMYIPMY